LTGIRRSELVRLGITSIDFDRNILIVRQGKGKKDRVLPVGGRALNWIQKYLDEARTELVVSTREATLFLNPYGEPISPDGMTRIVSRYMKKSGIGKSGSCHLFRHSMASHMLENGADIRYIQQMLGHANLSTTEIYTEVSIHQLKKVHALTHPASTPKVKKHAEEKRQ